MCSGSDDSTVRLWDAESGEFVASNNRHALRVLDVAFIPESHKVSGDAKKAGIESFFLSSCGKVLLLSGRLTPQAGKIIIGWRNPLLSVESTFSLLVLRIPKK